MANISIDSIKERTFDAIVIGSGISGGWAAKELTGKGLKTLVLERGRDVKHLSDYPTTNMFPWEFEHRLQMPLAVIEANPVVSRCYAFNEDSQHFFAKDTEQPYTQKKPFDWIRGNQVGGKSLLWARHTQRWSDFDFEGPLRDGFAVDWPIRYKDLEPWYSYVEKFAGISGHRDGLAQLPDGEFLPAFELSVMEQYFKDQLKKTYTDRHVIAARMAHLSAPQQIHFDQGRGKCQNRILCQRGCPFGGYFSSNSSTLPWAQKTGKLTLRPFSIVQSVIYDEATRKASGVRIVDSNTGQTIDYYARIIFVNASALSTNHILLNSKSKSYPDGLGNVNGLMGKYVAFHNYRGKISAEAHMLHEFTTDGRKPGSGYIPRFRNLLKQDTDFLRGYAAGFGASRKIDQQTPGLGASLKNQLLNPRLGNWQVNSHMMGETIPKESSSVSLDMQKKDKWGMPLLEISMGYDENDEKMIADFFTQFTEMYKLAGFTNIQTRDTKQAPGLDIHEMGGIRMGRDPKTSLLNEWNQLHEVKNVFITDGACMTSTATQNPSLTYMALTARAANRAVGLLKKGEL